MSDDRRSPWSTPKWRLWLRVLLGLLGAFVVLLASALWLLTHLEQPWVKRRVERALSNAVGTEVSYERLSISPFSGLEVHGLVLATPESLQSHAPEMLRLDALFVPIEVRPLFSGQVVVPEIRGGGLTLTVVTTDDGRHSFGELVGVGDTPEPGDSDPATTPLSHSLDSLDGIPLRLGPVRLSPIRARVLQVVGDNVATDTTLEAFAIASEGLVLGETLQGTLSIEPHESDQVTLTVHDLADHNAGDQREARGARFEPRLEARLEPQRVVSLLLTIGLTDQSLFPELRPVRSLVHIEGKAHFEREQARTKLELNELTLFDSMLVATATVAVTDDHVSVVDCGGVIEASSLPWALPWLQVDDLTSRFEVSSLALDPGGVTGGHATLEGSLREARYADGPASYEVRGVRWTGQLGAPNDSTDTLGMLEVNATLDEVLAKESGVFAASLERFTTVLELRALGVDDTGMWGLEGIGSLGGSIARVSVNAGTRVRAKNASLDLDIDLAHHRVEGRMPVARLVVRAPGLETIVLQRPELGIAAREPLHWATGHGAPSVDVDASVARVSLGGKHFRAKDWIFGVRRTGLDRYALQSRVHADRVRWGNFDEADKSSLVVEALIDGARNALELTAALSIAGEAETRLALSASHDAPASRYELALVGSQSGPLLGWLLFGGGGRRSDRLDFAFESRGDFRGLVYEDRSGSLRVSKEPLRTLRGTHESKVEVQHAYLMRGGIAHELEGLTVTARSTHEAPGRGRLEAEVSFAAARYGEPGWELALHDYAHRLDVAYAALHGAPSFSIRTRGTIGEMRQPYFRQYPLENATFGADVDVADTRVVAVREAYFRNPAGGTRFESRAAYEGWQEAIRGTEVCSVGTEGCPEVDSMYGREAAMVTGTFEQDFGSWRSTERTKSGGSFFMPFTIESGDLSTYRVTATAQFRDVVLELPQYGLLVDDLDALIPIEQEIATTPRVFVVPTNAANAMARQRFFDLHPFTKRDSFFTVNRVQLGRETLGPIAANLQVVGPVLAMDQLHAAYRNGFITGQILGDLSRDDPKLVFRGNITGVETTGGRGVLDANVALTFVPTTLILQGKAQVVRISKDHLHEIIDVLDPYHEDEDLNRVRLALKIGYPKFVLLKMDEGLMNAKIDLGGLAGAVRIDEIKGIPVTPFIEQYVQPFIERVLSPSAAARAMIVENEGI